MFLKPAFLKESISSDDNLIKEAYIEASKTVRQLLFVISGFSIFCLISLGSPDIYLLGESKFISVPFAGQMSFSLFMILGPIILLSFRVYLHLYESHYRTLHFLLNKRSVIMPPNLTIFNNIILKFFAKPSCVSSVPFVIFFFSNKARAISLFIYPSLIVAIIVVAIHIILLVSRSHYRNDIFKKSIIITILLSINLCVIIFLVDIDKIRRPLNLFRADLSSQWLVGSDLKHANLQSANFTGTNLSGSDLSSANLKDVNFENAKLENVNFMNSDLSNAKFINSILSGSNFSKAKIYSTTFKSSNLLKTKFNNSNIEKTFFYENIFSDHNIVKKAENDDCHIFEVGYGLREENCEKIFDYLDELTEGSIDFSKANFIDTDFSNQDCRWVNFRYATFNNVMFLGVNLAGSLLSEAKFWDVQLAGDLTAADLSDAEFNNTSLANVTLDKTNLYGVDLSDTDIEEDQINETSCWYSTTKFPSNIDISKLKTSESCD